MSSAGHRIRRTAGGRGAGRPSEAPLRRGYEPPLSSRHRRMIHAADGRISRDDSQAGTLRWISSRTYLYGERGAAPQRPVADRNGRPGNEATDATAQREAAPPGGPRGPWRSLFPRPGLRTGRGLTGAGDSTDGPDRGRVHGGSHPHLVNEFVDAVAHSRQPSINVWEAARYMAMGVMAHQSALRDGERLDVPDWGDGPE